jgi:hypothetical protein
MRTRLAFATVFVLLTTAITASAGAVDWPLRINATGKYLEDQSGVPFLLIGDAGWGLAVRLSQADIVTYLNDRQSKGINAIEVRLIDHAFCPTCPTNINGDPPFCKNPTGACTGVHNPWTNRNEAYWTNVDYIIDQAKARGMVILGFPAYLGYSCGSEGWCADMQAQTNADMTNYGQWIGDRYKDKGNIIWMCGGDTDASNYSNVLARDTALVNAIRSVDTDAIFSVEPQNNTIGGIDSYMTLVDINANYTYGYEETSTRRAYQTSSRPFMLQEAYYENTCRLARPGSYNPSWRRLNRPGIWQLSIMAFFLLKREEFL